MERACAGLSSLLALAACTASEGPLFTPQPDGGAIAPLLDGAGMGPGADARAEPIEAGQREPDTGAGPSAIQPGMRIQYQLSGTLELDADADLFVIDLFETSRTQIEQLHDMGKAVVAFVSAGSLERWRPDVDQLPAAAIGKPLAGYPEEAWLDVRNLSVRQLMVGRITLAADKGFDGALLVSLDAYLADSGHDLSAADQLDYNVWLAQRAAQAGLTAGISSDWPHAAQLAPHYGFAIHLNCVANQRCGELAAFRTLGRAVFDLETGTVDQAGVCSAAKQLDLPVTLKRGSFDAWSVPCP